MAPLVVCLHGLLSGWLAVLLVGRSGTVQFTPPDPAATQVFTVAVAAGATETVNLIVNAAQAMRSDARGEIVLSTRAENGYVVAAVRDNGIGMSEKTISQIFDPFFTTKRGKGGTGLGLFIVHRIIQEHKGTISVTSSLACGSTFVLRFPAAKSEITESENRQ